MPVQDWRRPCQGLHKATFLAYVERMAAACR